jgi:phosphoglycolate phosphatase
LAKKVIVFDFDGTLIQSNRLKYEAYFQLFPNEPGYREVIETILKTSFEESRYVILRRILLGLGTEEGLEDRVAGLAAGYNHLVLAGAIACPETGDAGSVLKSLQVKFHLYLSSTTPEESLQTIVESRGWRGFFRDIYGYPRKKAETLRTILEAEKITPEEMLVVGDGESDQDAARAVGCGFIRVSAEVPLSETLKDFLA